MTAHLSLQPLLLRLSALMEFEAEDEAELEGLVGRAEFRRAGTSLAAEASEMRRAYVVVSGWLLRTRLLSDGRRQVLGCHVAGDLVNFALHPDPLVACDIECLTDVSLLDATALRRHVASADDSDRLCRAIRLSLALDEALALANMSRLARQSAYERLGLLFLDLHYRLGMVGLADATSFPMPLTQQVLSDALGLSIVHVNRTLKQLRTDRLVERAHKRVILPDPEALARAVDHAIPPFAATRGGKGLRPTAPRPMPTLAKLGS
jgi:CRP-like cAMP-binding protein